METPAEREERLFREAARRPAGPERNAFLDQACAGQPDQRERLAAMLAAHDSGTDFLRTPGMPAPASRFEEAGPTVIDRYEVREQLGEGGFGVVYLAHQRAPVERMVALKIIKPGMDTRQVVARFEAERQALARMDHPAIARVFDAGSTDAGRPYFVMELVRGIPITTYCDRERLPLRQRLELFVPICRAVQHAHQKGIIHRDLKPSNILVTVSDGVALPKIIDFGIAKALHAADPDQAGLTRGDQWIGTPAYMSPEQARPGSEDIDTRSDVYSLGALLYELVTGRTPLDGRGLLAGGMETLRQALLELEPTQPSVRLARLTPAEAELAARQRRTEPSKLRRQLAGDLDCIILKCLAKDRGQRYATANGLAMDLERHLNDEVILARPPSRLDRWRRMLRRHRLAFATAGAITASLVAGLGTATFFWLRERDAHWRADAAGRETMAALSHSDFVQALRLGQEDRDADALAYLQRSVAENPANVAAGMRLLTLLTGNTWMRPRLQLDLPATVNDACFSPDGRRVAVGLGDGTVELRETATGQSQTGPIHHGSGVLRILFSPDGQRLLTLAWNRTARVWDANSGQALTPPISHGALLRGAAFSPDGNRLATGAADGSVRVWWTATGEPAAGPLSQRGAVIDLQFSPDGATLATAGEDATVMVWDLREGRARLGPLRHDSWVNSVRFSPDGRRLLTASADHSARLWDVATGRESAAPMVHGQAVVSARFSPDGGRVATASLDGTAGLWEAATGRPIGQPLRHRGPVSSAEFSADGARLVTASSDRTAQLWDARTGRRLAEPLGMNAPLKTAAFSAEGGRVLTAGGRSLRLWGTPWLAAQPLRLGTGLFTKTAAFSPDGRRVLLARADGTARLYDRRTGEPVGQPMVHRALLVAAQFSPDGRWVLTASQDGTVRLWHGATGEPAAPPLAHEGQPGDAAFSPDGRLIATVTEEGSVRIWNAPSGQPLTPVLKHAEAVNVARFSPDSRWLVTGSSDGFVRIWDAHRGDAIGRPLAHDRLVHDAGFSPDASRLATTSADGTARLWNTATWEPAGAPLVLGRPVVAARFLPDGRRLVTADADGRLGVWEVDEGRLLVEIRGMDSAGLFQVRTDGAFLAAATTDGPIQLLEAATLQPATAAFSSGRMPHALGFSPDGRHLLSASSGAFLWDVPLGKSPCPAWLGLLAELVGGRVLQPQHVLADSPLDPIRTIERIERQLQQESADDDWAIWARWFLAPARDRAISPHSALTLSNDVRRLHSPDASSIRAQRLALTAGDPELLASLPPEADLRADPDAVANSSAPPGPQIYDGRLRHGWEDYSWCQVEFGGADTSPASPTGPRPMVVKVAPWQALYLHHAPFNPEGFDRLSFWIHGGDAEKSLIVRATIRGTAQPLIPISPPAHVWTHVVLPLKALHAAGDAGFDGFWIQEAQGKNQSAFYVDRVELLPPGDAGDRPEPPAPPR